jgi:hypothetical protein
MRIPAFTPGDYIRFVPLHYPKPTVPIADLARLREAEERDFFEGQPAPAAATPQLTYRGGPLLQNPEVFTVFWGKTWGTTPSSTALMDKLHKFFADILAGPLIDQLAEYDVPAQAIGQGSFIGTKVISAAAPLASITDSALQAHLRKWLKTKLLPKQTRNTLYFVYLEPGIVSIMGGGRSCQNYCGYHNNVGGAYYAVMPYPTCSGCLGGLSTFDALTGTSSHESHYGSGAWLWVVRRREWRDRRHLRVDLQAGCRLHSAARVVQSTEQVRVVLAKEWSGTCDERLNAGRRYPYTPARPRFTR